MKRIYLIKVEYALSGLFVYKVETDNVYRIIGKIYCTSLEKIERLDYSRHTCERELFWLSNGYLIHTYKEPMLCDDLYDNL